MTREKPTLPQKTAALQKGLSEAAEVILADPEKYGPAMVAVAEREKERAKAGGQR